MDTKYFLNFFEGEKFTLIKKKHHSYLQYHTFDESYIYILKDGIVKTSVILPDGREANISYVVAPNIVSLLRDEVSNFTTSPFNIRIESEYAYFYCIPRVTFWNLVNSDQKLQRYVRDYYRLKLHEMIKFLYVMTINGKKGAVCALLCKLTKIFGIKRSDGILIDFSVTNEDVAFFCGISSRNSVNRIMHNLKQENVIEIINPGSKILVKNLGYLNDYYPVE